MRVLGLSVTKNFVRAIVLTALTSAAGSVSLIYRTVFPEGINSS